MAQEMNLGMKCIKYMLFVVNLMFVLTAALIISVGTTIYDIYSEFRVFLDNGYLSPASLLVAIGIMMLFVSAFGCWGAIKESTCMINLYALMLTLVFVLEISAAIAAYSLQGGLRNMIAENLNETIHKYEEGNEYAMSIDFVQNKLGCCGVNSAQDWFGIINNETMQIPLSCCETLIADDDGYDKCLNTYDSGCLNRLTYLIGQSAILLGTGALTIAFIQLIGIVFSIMLGKSIRQAKTERERRRWEIREQIANAYTQMEPHTLSKQPENSNPVIYIPTTPASKF